jgi:signal transduction histidine kinase
MSSISIDFAALSYLSPSMIEYHYIMEGLDKEWINMQTNRKVYYTNLTPGRYVFKVKAVTNGIKTDDGKTLVIVIEPPWWATIFAYFFYTLLAGILLYYIVYTYHRRQVNKKEKEIYESKIEFFTNVAHEIRTPLTLIKGPVENLMEREHDLPDLNEDLACLDRNTNRLMDLVTQILDFRQTEIKGFSLDMERVNINDVLKECFLSFGIMAKKKHLDFTLNMPPTELIAQADKEALYKIIFNLIGNAVKYAGSLVRVTLLADGQARENFSIMFENDGHIITPEMENKIFEPFYRLKENHEQKGTGIGLTLARSLTELHQGKLQLHFAGQRVNTFVLSLPYKPA